MKPIRVQDNKVTFADEKHEKKKHRQAKLAEIAEKKKTKKLTLEDIDAKLDIIIEMLESR